MNLSSIIIGALFFVTGCAGLPSPAVVVNSPTAPVTLPATESSSGQIQFQEVTDAAGLSYSEASHGASWGDFNGDGWPDVWTSNHNRQFGLYLNQADGTFTNIITDVLSVTGGGDTHGAAWADFDNDGDQDLVQQAGAAQGKGQGSSQLYINEAGKLTDRAADLGVDDPLGRGRTPLWLDWDGDGQLDLLLTNGQRPDGQAPSALFKQNNGGFQQITQFAGTARFAQLAGISGHDSLDLLIHGVPYPLKIHNQNAVSPNGWQDLTHMLLPERVGAVHEAVHDVAIADFNNDLQPDIYLARSKTAATDVFQPNNKQIRAQFKGNKKPKSISFQATEALTFQLFTLPHYSLELFIGHDGKTPVETASFTLSPQDPGVSGIKPLEAVSDGGLYIGFEPDSQRWQVLISTAGQYEFSLAIDSPGVITNLTTTGFEPVRPSIPSQLLLYHQGQYKNQTPAGLDVPNFCSASVVAGDFDNDMDVDVYLVCARVTANVPNRLYENLGDGTFVAVPEAGGAAGTLLGIGDSVSMVDYDRDGFLDLFVTNSAILPPFFWGPNQLFRNQGNQNHWLEIDLEGVVSNRDGIGARILATAGGVTQIREQGGGMHYRTQNHQRIHFGLGSNTMVDQLIIQWPGGIVQKLENVAADQILHVVEPDEQ
jgi:hypothetical protein